jgi:serine/threonine protein kinase
MVSAVPPPPAPEAGANHPADVPSALPVGARVAEFEIRDVLGSGGFGIVYLAWDHALEREVAVKEYMPGTLAGRGGDMSVSVRSTSMADTFALGLRSFVNEARMLARFDHPSLVKVYRFWEANGTAYMVMPYYKGRTLRKVRAGMVMPPGEGACRKVLDALLSALEVLHKEGVFHRDIAPDNILIGEDGAPVLLDFGAARRVIEGGNQKALTSIMKPHFAPLEQYADQSAMRQGPWTDLYALGGTIYFLLSGREPVPAASRALHDDQPRLGEFGLEDCTPHFLATIDWMMAIKPPERPQSVFMLRDVLEGRITVPGRAARERTQPGVSSRETVDILTSPGDLSPDTGTGDAASPTVLMPRADAALGAALGATPGAPPEPLPQPAQTAAPVAASESLLPRRSSVAVLAALVVANVLAWWWYTRGDAPSRAEPAPVAKSVPAAKSVPTVPTAAASMAVTAAPSGAASAPLAVARPADRGDNETILSVLPARVPRAPTNAASAATPVTAARSPDTPPPRSAPIEPVAPRVADATAGSTPKAAAAAESANPRVRCGERNFFSMLVCLKRECQNPAISAHAECVKLREQEASSRSGDSQ